MNYALYGAPYPTYMPRSDAFMGTQTAPQAPQSYGQANTQQQAQTGFQCRPVTSREEAVAFLTDYFSPGTLMPDFGHGTVYFKRFNPNTGASDFYEFALVQQEKNDPIERIGFELASMSERIDGLSAKFDEFRQETTRSVTTDVSGE